MKFIRQINHLIPGLLCVLTGWASMAYSQNRTIDTLSFNISNQIFKFLYYGNYSLDDTLQHVKHAVVIIHGTNRNADDYYDRVLTAAMMADEAQDSTIIIAPQFLIPDDNPPSGFLYWQYNSRWKKGDKSSSNLSRRISSFAVMDTIFYRLVKNHSGLQGIVLAGHSAGGQFVNRYAAGNQMEQTIYSTYGIPVRYIVANPSSYLYFNEERRVEDTVDQFSIPPDEEIQICPTYNDYKYGLNDLNSYMSNVGVDQILSQYQQREIVYLLGGEDNDPNHSSLDTGCEAMLQGNHRLQRGNIYYNYLAHFFGDSIYQKQEKVLVADVGHSSTGMFHSDCGIYFLFDYGDCSSLKIKSPNYIAREFILAQNYPNPFNPVTAIRFELPERSQVSIKIYDFLGREIKTLISGNLDPGFRQAIWNGMNKNGRPVSSGMYIYTIIAKSLESAKSYTDTKKMVLIK